MNKQPFYHRAVVLFTATRELSREELEEVVKNTLRLGRGVILPRTIQVEECDAEPGDPADLVGA